MFICNDMVTLSKVGVLEKYYKLCDNIPNDFVMDKEWHNDIINLLGHKLGKGHFKVKVVNDCNLYISWCASN